MIGRFLKKEEIQKEDVGWGTLMWLSSPTLNQAKSILIVEVEINPGGGHSFHTHPNQEEMIYVLDGQVEQWLEGEKRILGVGETVFVPANTVHASFNSTSRKIRLLATLSPVIGPTGYEIVDVSEQAPWSKLRID